MGPRHVLIYLSLEKDVVEALTCRSHQIGTTLFRWSTDFNTRIESTKAVAWVRIPYLRADLYNEGFLKRFSAALGRYLDADAYTKARTNAEYARVCVEVDLVKELLNEIWVDLGDGNPWWQEVIFEGKLAFCSKCKLQGHGIGECRKIKSRQVDNVQHSHMAQKSAAAPSKVFVAEKEKQEGEQGIDHRTDTGSNHNSKGKEQGRVVEKQVPESKDSTYDLGRGSRCVQEAGKSGQEGTPIKQSNVRKKAEDNFFRKSNPFEVLNDVDEHNVLKTNMKEPAEDSTDNEEEVVEVIEVLNSTEVHNYNVVKVMDQNKSDARTMLVCKD